MTKSTDRRRLEEYERQARPGFIAERERVVRGTRRVAERRAVKEAAGAFPPRKEEAACCRAKQLPDGRPVLGFCSPECVRRPGNWELIRRGRPVPPGGVPPRRSA